MDLECVIKPILGGCFNERWFDANKEVAAVIIVVDLQTHRVEFKVSDKGFVVVVNGEAREMINGFVIQSSSRPIADAANLPMQIYDLSLLDLCKCKSDMAHRQHLVYCTQLAVNVYGCSLQLQRRDCFIIGFGVWLFIEPSAVW